MNDAFAISPTEFVLKSSRTPLDEDLRRRLEAEGTVQTLSGPAGYYVFRTEKSPRDPRAAWESVREEMRPEESQVVVLPVLIDDAGNHRYPLGTISVRFVKALSDEELDAFCDPMGLSVVRRNAFVPGQVTFQPVDSRTFLPDLVERIRQCDRRFVVWPETLSHFRRE